MSKYCHPIVSRNLAHFTFKGKKWLKCKGFWEFHWSKKLQAIKKLLDFHSAMFTSMLSAYFWSLQNGKHSKQHVGLVSHRNCRRREVVASGKSKHWIMDLEFVKATAIWKWSLRWEWGNHCIITCLSLNIFTVYMIYCTQVIRKLGYLGKKYSNA